MTGLRVFTFFYPDEAALPRVSFSTVIRHRPFGQGRGGKRTAMVLDPANQWVELVVVPGASQEVYDSIELGMTVSDLEKSRAFYREFVGLDELPPVEDPVLGVDRYPYRHGTTTVTVWSFGKGTRGQHAKRRHSVRRVGCGSR